MVSSPSKGMPLKRRMHSDGASYSQRLPPKGGSCDIQGGGGGKRPERAAYLVICYVDKLQITI